MFFMLKFIISMTQQIRGRKSLIFTTVFEVQDKLQVYIGTVLEMWGRVFVKGTLTCLFMVTNEKIETNTCLLGIPPGADLDSVTATTHRRRHSL